MKNKIRLLLLIVFVASMVITVLAHIEAHPIRGYELCGGDGFISQSSVDKSIGLNGINPGGPCTGNTITEDFYGPLTVSGYDRIFGFIIATSLVAYGLTLLRTKKRGTSK